MKYEYDSDSGETKVILDGEELGTLSAWPTRWANGTIPDPRTEYFSEFETIIRQMSSPVEREFFLHLLVNNVTMIGPGDDPS